MNKNIKELEIEFSKYLEAQLLHELSTQKKGRKIKGAFLTSDIKIIEEICSSIKLDNSIFEKKILEPACGHGAFLINLIISAYKINSDEKAIKEFISNKLFFFDIDPKMITETKNNIIKIYYFLFNKEYSDSFNFFNVDFTKINEKSEHKEITKFYNQFDYVLGNPPYISLYGRRDQKSSEDQRIYYLHNYSQFPSWLKNGKINYVMLFIEKGLQFLKPNGTLKYIIDTSFFETAYIFCRQLLVERYTIISLTYNISGFENVASGQLIIEVKNTKPIDNDVLVINYKNNEQILVKQSFWDNPSDEYKFRISHSDKNDKIIKKIEDKKDKTLFSLYPKKSLRTCVMLLDMEDQFIKENISEIHNSYPYYIGSKSIKSRYSKPIFTKYFHLNKNLQDSINEELKIELIKKGIKNKKRLGFGEEDIYINPKVYIRQSAKELIATYDENPSSANNSLYVFSFRNNNPDSIFFLKFLCGLLNSQIYNFFAQQRRIIRYNQGKQPQIKISDLYKIYIPTDKNIQRSIVHYVDKIYSDTLNQEIYSNAIDKILFDYYNINDEEIKNISSEIKNFVQ
jgi:tRNA1(Val) A37 N6-methylase TrmN6